MTLTEDQKATVQAWVEQLQDDGYATTGPLIDEPPLIKAGVMLADPSRYFARCRAERTDEAAGRRVQDEVSHGNC